MGSPWIEGNLCDIIKTDSQFTTKCPDIAADIFAGRLQLVEYVESLGELLTNPDVNARAQGSQILALTLKELPPDFLSQDELKFLGDFLCDRLKDHHAVLPAVFIGILAICNMKNIPKDIPSRLLSAMFLNVNCQSQRQTDRHFIYQILQCLIATHLNEIKEMGPDLVFGIISAMDGERDPRNLMLLFSMLPSILQSLPLGHLTEEFFEVMACYFPVDFKPSVDDPGSATRDDLAVLLASCLTAIPQFAEFCLPLLIEKLDSSLVVAKLDSLYLLEQGCKVFTADDLAVHLSPLWMSLSREALSNGQLEVREAALSAISSLLRNFALSPSSSQKSSPMQMLLSYIITATSSTLHEVQTNLFLPSSQLLLAAARSSHSACETIIKKVAPLLCQYFVEKSAVSEKVAFLQTLTMFLVSSLSLKVTPNDNPELQTLWSTVIPLYLSAAQNNNLLLRKEAFIGLTSLGTTLSFSERQLLYSIICSAVDSDENDCIRDECERCLCHIASLQPDEVLQNVLLDKLSLSGMSVSSSPKIFKYRLSARCQLAALESFTSHVIPSVVEMIITARDGDLAVTCMSSLRKLLKSLKEDNPNSEFIYAFLNKNVCTVSRLMKWWMAGIETSNPSSMFLNETLLVDTSELIRDIVKKLNACEQSSLLNECLPDYFPFLVNSHSFDHSSPPHISRTVLLLEAVIGPLHPKVSVPSVTKLCSFLVNLAIRCPDTIAHSSASRLTAALVNKTSEDVVLEEMLSSINSVLDSILMASSGDDGIRATSLLGWVIKGLLLRGSKDVQHWIDKLLILLGNPLEEIAMTAAHAFHIIMDQSPKYLNSQNHCTVKLLYRQRFFQCSSKLLIEYRQAPTGERSCYLLALAHLLQGVPQTVLTNNLGEVLPLLLESLALQSTVLLLASLDTLEMLLNQSMLRDHLLADIQTMVPRLLQLTSFNLSLKVRIGALRCLSIIANFPVELLLPFKQEVVTHLLKCLDDPKRLVRKEAVKARTRWILLDAPGTKNK